MGTSRSIPANYGPSKVYQSPDLVESDQRLQTNGHQQVSRLPIVLTLDIPITGLVEDDKGFKEEGHQNGPGQQIVAI
jgi:hypothetical protein